MNEVVAAWLLERRALREVGLRALLAGPAGLIVGGLAGEPLRSALGTLAAVLVLGLVEERARPHRRADHARAAASVLVLLPVAVAFAVLQADYAAWVVARRESGLGGVLDSLWRLARSVARRPEAAGPSAAVVAGAAAAVLWRLRQRSRDRVVEAQGAVVGLGVLAGGAVGLTSLLVAGPEEGELLQPVVVATAGGALVAPIVVAALAGLHRVVPRGAGPLPVHDDPPYAERARVVVGVAAGLALLLPFAVWLGHGWRLAATAQAHGLQVRSDGRAYVELFAGPERATGAVSREEQRRLVRATQRLNGRHLAAWARRLGVVLYQGGI